VAASVLNSELLIAGILRRARALPDPAAYLGGLHDAAYTAVMAGDEYVTNISADGGSSTADRSMPATVLLQLYEAALQSYEATAAAGARVGDGSVRHGDFSQTPSILG